MSSCERPVQPYRAARRAAWTLLAAAALETAVTLGHFAHGAHAYADPSRLHVVAPALIALALLAAATLLFSWRPGKLTFAPIAVLAAVPFVGVFGAFHGGYGHVAKLAAFAAGASRETLDRLFASPDYAFPDDVAFEVTGRRRR